MVSTQCRSVFIFKFKLICLISILTRGGVCIKFNGKCVQGSSFSLLLQLIGIEPKCDNAYIIEYDHRFWNYP